MKKLGIVFGLLLGASTLLGQVAGSATPQPCAYRAPAPEEAAKIHTNRLSKALCLTEAQYAHVYDAHLSRARTMAELRAANPAHTPQLKARREALRTASIERIRAVLTPAQQAQYEQLLAEQRAKREARKH
jgi:Spy/CpxP family protein refolding chaperone